MPQSHTARVVPQKQVVFWNEVPRTTFRDLHDAVKVELMNDTMAGDIAAILEETHASTWSPVPPTSEKATPISELMRGSRAFRAAELMDFTFKITGVSRAFTHQLVRARIGVSFFQQNHGDTDTRHANILVPRAISAKRSRFDAYIEACLAAKHAYAGMVDACIPIQEARYVMPHGVETYTYMHASLATLINMYHSRVCTMVNMWETHLFATRMAAELVKEWPELFDLFYPSKCSQGKCACSTDKALDQITPWYQPDVVHDLFDWNPKSFTYNRTHADMSDPEDGAFEPFSYTGYTRD